MNSKTILEQIEMEERVKNILWEEYQKVINKSREILHTMASREKNIDDLRYLLSTLEEEEQESSVTSGLYVVSDVQEPIICVETTGVKSRKDVVYDAVVTLTKRGISPITSEVIGEFVADSHNDMIFTTAEIGTILRSFFLQGSLTRDLLSSKDRKDYSSKYKYSLPESVVKNNLMFT